MKVGTPSTKLPYRPPVDDEPLDEIERAFVRAVVAAIVAELREEDAVKQADHKHEDQRAG